MQLAMLELLLVHQLFGSVAAVEGELLVVAELVAEHAVVVELVAAAVGLVEDYAELEDEVVVDDVEQ